MTDQSSTKKLAPFSALPVLILLGFLFAGCGLRQRQAVVPPPIDFVRVATPQRLNRVSGSYRARPMSAAEIIADASRPRTGDEAVQEFNELGKSWLYGHGLGRSLGNIGTSILFPPYALYLLGNTGLSLAGLPQLQITKLLPETPREHALEAYDGVTSVPGRVLALINSEEFRAEEFRAAGFRGSGAAGSPASN